jgi:uracil-DNA glycosylase family 4
VNERYRQSCLSTMGIARYVRREQLSGDIPGQLTEPAPEIGQTNLQHDDSVPAVAVAHKPVFGSWQQLRSEVKTCTGCELHAKRTQTVFGTGDENADLLLIGEAPGAEEDRQGEPFVGAAGQLLNAMLHAVGLKREQVYIANIVKCRPPGNRNPAKTEAGACRQYLDRQIELIQPRVILSMGAVSAHNLLLTDESVGRLRQRPHHYGKQNIPLMVTYHPAYLLRSPAEKAKVWLDLQKLVQLMQ